MSLLSYKCKIVVDRAIGASGHGKSVVDAINGVDKNAIRRKTMKKVQPASEAVKKESSGMQVQSFNSFEGEHQQRYSAAEDCVRTLELETGAEGCKSVVKRGKREANRGINQRHWHVRKIDQKLNTGLK
jgi:hypothetical protein